MAICSFQVAILNFQLANFTFQMAISSSNRLPVLQLVASWGGLVGPPLVWPLSLKNGTRAR